MSAPNALSVALLEACGLDPDKVKAISYSHEVGDLPELVVTEIAIDADVAKITETTERFRISIEPKRRPSLWHRVKRAVFGR